LFDYIELFSSGPNVHKYNIFVVMQRVPVASVIDGFLSGRSISFFYSTGHIIVLLVE